MAGWYTYAKEGQNGSLAAVVLELIKGKTMWCAHIHEGMPPGDAQFRKLKDAKAWVEQKCPSKGS